MTKEYLILTLEDKNNINWEEIPKAMIDENTWNSVEPITSFAQLVFVPEYGFILKLTAKEKNPWAEYRTDGDPVCLDSCLEAFLLFGDEGYINLESNSIGTRLQAIGKNRFDRHSILDFAIKPIVFKTENDWSLIYYIPLKMLQKIYQNLDISLIKPGFSFKGNFYKTGKNPLNGEEHYYMWNRIETPNPDFHQSSQFGNLKIK